MLKLYEQELTNTEMDVGLAINMLLQDNPIKINEETIYCSKKLNALFENNFKLFYPH